MSDLARDELIDGIILFALEDLVTWSEPLPLKNIGPSYPEEFGKFTDKLEAFKADLRTHLQMLTLQELQNDFPRTTTAAFNLLFDDFGRAGRLAQRLARLKKDRPMDCVGIDVDKVSDWIDTFSVSVDERFRRMINDRRKRAL